MEFCYEFLMRLSEMHHQGKFSYSSHLLPENRVACAIEDEHRKESRQQHHPTYNSE